MQPNAGHLEELRQIAATLKDVLDRLDALDALVAAAHVQASLDAVTSMVDETALPSTAPVCRKS